MTRKQRPAKPRPDRTDDALLDFVEAVLDDFFLDRDNQSDYEAIVRGGRKARVKAGDPVELATMAFSNDGTVTLEAHAGAPGIALTISHSRFQAVVETHYTIKSATVDEARIVRFAGDRATARKLADKWSDELSLVGDDEMFEALTTLLSGDDSLFDDEDESPDESPFANDDDPGEPPPPTDRDKAMVEALANALTREMKRKKPNPMALQDDMLALEQSPQLLWPILDGTIATCAAPKRDEEKIEVWRLLLEGQLTLIRYRIDAGWDWASRMALEFQRKLIEIGREGRIRPEDFSSIAGALGEARIEVSPETRQALADAGLSGSEPDDMSLVKENMNGLLNQMAASVSNPFDVVEALGEATRVLPTELRCFMAHEFALSPHAVLRDTVPLLLLAEEQDVRRAAAGALEQTASPDTMSPESLRRMIAVRNWVPEADRPPIDQAIRKARLNGVVCAAWPPDQDLRIVASSIDGSGAQSIVLTSRGSRKGTLAGMLLKLGIGVSDSWCHVDAPRRDLNEAIAAIREAGIAADVDRAYLDEAVQHALGLGTASARPPHVSLLRIAELAGGAEWRDRRLDIAAGSRLLFEALPDARRTPDAVEASLARSGAWIDEDFAESWFLNDAEVRAIVKQAPRGDRNAATRRLIADAFPKHRAVWAERFLLLALRARAVHDPVQKGRAEDFIVLASTLCGDRDLSRIPLMAAIARYTVEAARMARW